MELLAPKSRSSGRGLMFKRFIGWNPSDILFMVNISNLFVEKLHRFDIP